MSLSHRCLVLPDGSAFRGYVHIGHTSREVKRCLETSGDDKFRNVIARSCSDSQTYQDYALTPNGEVRQMGRCLTTLEGDKSFGDGYQLGLRECTDIVEQKWRFDKICRILQLAAPRASAATAFALKGLAENRSFATDVKKVQAEKDDGEENVSNYMCITEGQIFEPNLKLPFLPNTTERNA